MRWIATTMVLLAVTAATDLTVAQQPTSQGQTQPQQTQPKKKEEAPAAVSRLRIEVTGGDANVPVENASVYVKTIEQHLIKDKKLEVNVKTNQKGIAHVPDAPTGRVEIQIVAEGWKTYGHWYDINDPNQVIKVHLERPPKWY